MKLRHSWLVVVILLIAGGRLTAQVQSAQEFKRKCLGEWKTLLEKVQTVRMESKDERYDAHDGKPLALTNLVISRLAASPAGMLQSYKDDKLDAKGAVRRTYSFFHLWNEQYHASLNEKKGGDGWLLGEFAPGKKVKDSAFRQRFPWLWACYLRLEELIPDPSFEITQMVASEPEGNSALLRVHFRFDATRKEDPTLPEHVRSGYIDFDTAHAFRPTAYEFQVKDKSIESVDRGLLEYEPGGDIPLLTRTTWESPTIRVGKSGRRSMKTIKTYKIEYNVQVPDEEFRLSFYGLPELVGVTWKKPVPTYIWFGTGALLCLLLSAGSWQALRRYRARQTTNNTASP